MDIKSFFTKRINLLIILISSLMMIAVLNLPFKAKPFGDATFHTEAKNLARYLKALSIRQERALIDPVKDQARMLEVKPFVDVLAKHLQENQIISLVWQRYWLDVEELCVHIYVQELAVKGGHSTKRLAKQLPHLT